jgi:hypothetical protein
MKSQTDFATRVKRINKDASKTKRKSVKAGNGLGSMMVMPLMTSAFVAGGVVMYWEALERPTDSPLEFASNLTSQLLAYLV